MCELMGMSFNQEVNARFSFGGFTKRGDDNPHGWGMAYYPKGAYAAQVIKERFKARDSKMADFIKNYDKVRSSVYIAHVRYATSDVIFANTHPFVRECRGREFVFAHNGVLKHSYRSELTTGRWTPVGTTDSEHAFCYLMGKIEGLSGDWNIESFTILQDALIKVNSYGTFNCLLSDGEYLFCYRDKDVNYKGLCYTHRKAPFSTAKLVDEDMEINLDGEKDASENGYIIATAPLTHEEWIDLQPSKMTVFRKGAIAFCGAQCVTEEKILQALRFIRTSPRRVSVSLIAKEVSIGLGEIDLLIGKLVSRGYIIQDSRDAGGPFDGGSTYYTVLDKRVEIDRLIISGKQ